MFFNNALVYRFNRDIKFDVEKLEQQLKEFMFTPCGATDPKKFGWVEPLGKLGGSAMTHVADGNVLLTAQLQVKRIPSQNLRKSLDAKVARFEEAEGRPLKKAEKDAIREEVVHDLLPRAFETDSYANVLIMTKHNFIVVDASSFNKAEEVLALLRKSIGSLPVVPVQPKSAVETILTQWIKTGQTPADFTAMDKVVLSSVLESGGKATLAKQDLTSEEVLKHIEADKVVTKLNIDWQERLEFTLGDDFSIKGIKWCDDLKDQNGYIPNENELARFDADFALVCGELSAFLPQLIDCFGGLVEAVAKEELSMEDAVESDALVKPTIDLFKETRRASVSAIQRKFKIGYNRAARIMELLEALNVVSPIQSNGSREVLVSDQ